MIRSLSKSLLRLTAALVAGTAILIAASAWRLSAGPVSLGFLSPYVRDALTLGGARDIRVTLADTILTWVGPDRGLEIRALDVSATDVRARIRSGRSLRYLVPESVREAIEQSGAYPGQGAAMAQDE